ncbi:putative PD-(D/E)XK family protein DUF4420 [Chitinophaga niastensis]|uniref:Putative PD-(D/E)XK family protein DUF4420 n=1 Tax=Chitinophaga niastensis TaxID=536980 RepID=A0A2P8HTL1_CHINA|nr:PD-(D/E)XK motif protein [Chitinophaga niastensis]PSL49504.1 putative PD-(D/E)XK family protein DUF4420 [Chitinophaga niastensis]
MILKWDELKDANASGYRQLRFPVHCEHEIYYAIDPTGNRCILFYINDRNHSDMIRDNSFKNISLETKKIYSKAVIVLTLLDNGFSDIFDYFIGSILESLVDVTTESVAIDRYLQCYNKWVELFHATSSGLKEKDVIGLIGELLMFEHVLNYSGASAVDVINSWRGPYGKGHDFELGGTFIEVKAIDRNKQLVNISSEYQLDFLSHQTLFLVVYELEASTDENSFTISALVRKIADLLRSGSVINTEGFWKALSKAGVNLTNIHEYDMFTFKLSECIIYKVDAEKFPSIKRSALPDAIVDVKYRLSLDAISEFKFPNIF